MPFGTALETSHILLYLSLTNLFRICHSSTPSLSLATTDPPPIMVGPRRSKRFASASYESNGRDYLAAELQISREDLENWLTSSTVHPHLLLWYNLCVVGSRRFNEAIEWINTGDTGYFYNKNDLEEDLLLMCLCEGSPGDLESGEKGYANEAARTSDWVTQELWARTAWRIVHYNSSEGQLFERVVINHVAAAYGLVIDILCIAFHSIAFRKSASIWEEIIHSGSTSPSTTSTGIAGLASLGQEMELDQKSELGSVAGSNDDELDPSDADSEESSDEDFSDDTFSVPKTPEPDGSEVVMTPKAPKKAKEATQMWLDALPHAAEAQEVESKKAGDHVFALSMVDEEGMPITGYRSAQA